MRHPQASGAADLEKLLASEFGCRLVFINGRFAPELSQTKNLPASVKVDSLARALDRGSEQVKHHLAHYEDFHDEAFTALNTAFLDDGAYVHVPRGVVLEEPIYLVYVGVGASTPAVTHPRSLILVDENAQASVVEDYISLGESPAEGLTGFCNAVTELVVW